VGTAPGRGVVVNSFANGKCSKRHGFTGLARSDSAERNEVRNRADRRFAQGAQLNGKAERVSSLVVSAGEQKKFKNYI
jgi:hypothetical protein